MKRLSSWLKTKLSQPKAPLVTNQPSDSVSVEPDDSIDTESPGPKEGRGQNVVMPDIYADAHVATEPDLKILDQPTPDIDEPAGFNPYDTGVLQKKQRR